MKKQYVFCLFLAVFSLVHTCYGAKIYKLNNTEPVDTAASWKDGVVPGDSDTAAWGSAITANNSSPVTQPLTWDGMEIAADALSDMTIYGSTNITFDGGASPDFNILSHYCPKDLV